MSAHLATFRFGLSPSLGFAQTRRVAERIEQALVPVAARPVSVAVAGSYEHLEAMVLGGAVDAAWVNPLLLARLYAVGATVRLRGVRRGSSTFVSALVGRADGVADLHGQQGLRAAWTDPDSLAGYRLPVRHLRTSGLQPERLFSSERFTFSYPAALGQVIDGSVDVAACFVHRPDADALASVLERLVGADAGRLVPLAFTEPVPNDGIVFAPHLQERAAAFLSERILAFSQTEAGRRVLSLLDIEALVTDEEGIDPAADWLAV